MIDTINLKKILSEEKDSKVREMKSSAYEGMASSLLNYKEEYKYTPLLRKIEKKFNSLSPEKSLNKNIKYYKGLIPQSEKFYLFILNGNYEESLSNKPDNILVSEYSKLSIKQKEEFSKSFSKYDDSKSDFFSSANTINHDDCLIIRIERNKALKENIAIINPTIVIENTVNLADFQPLLLASLGFSAPRYCPVKVAPAIEKP